ncbi:MAG: enoyl-ACP reductase [Verrucomicrobia bacterium]|nr:MAG: enoyl-ACP reductase [Verrucomicrobiota bacterium]
MTPGADVGDLFSLKARGALVVGGTRGIGRAIAWRLAKGGARVVANYVREQASAASLDQEAVQAGVALETFRADVTSSTGINSLVEFVAGRFERLSILVYAAASGVHRPFDQLTVRQLEWTFHLNVRAFFEVVQRFTSRMQTGSTIVALSSEGAVHAIPQYSLVGASKGALGSMARHMAAELAPRGIRVNILSPGTVLTEAWKVLPDAERRLADAAKRSPLGRLNTLEEVAWAAQFLCSDAASGINGHTLVVDGGARIVG